MKKFLDFLRLAWLYVVDVNHIAEDPYWWLKQINKRCMIIQGSEYLL